MKMTCLGQDLEGRNMVLVGSENSHDNLLIDTEKKQHVIIFCRKEGYIMGEMKIIS